MDPTPIDRIAATQRPRRLPLMYHKWRSLLFLHWEVAPEVVRALIPGSLDLDLFEGRAYVGLIPFTMWGVRPVGLPAVPWLSSSHETNVRTYVHVGGGDPGVWFFSLDASNRLAVAAARSLFHLNYQRARMTVARDPDGTLHYQSERIGPGPLPAVSDIRCRPLGEPAAARPGTLDHFLIERYFLYTEHNGRLLQGQVHHPPYPLQPAEVVSLDESLIAAAGIVRPDIPPLIHFATGVDVEVFALRPVPPPGAPAPSAS